MLLRSLAVFMLALRANAAFFGALIPATTYYVNQETGSDSNNGAFATPFLTLGKCATAISGVAGASCSVYGGTSAQAKYRESFNCSADRQALIGYGNFTPDITGLAVIAGGSWSNYSGSVYQFTATTENVVSAAWINIVENGTALTMATSLVGLTAPGYFVANNGSITGTSFTVYVYATGGGNPASNGKTYEYNARLQPVNCANNDRVTVSNVQTEWNLTNDGSIQLGKFGFLTNVSALHGTKHNILHHTGTVHNGGTISGAYYGGLGSTLEVYNQDTPNYEGLTLENLTISMPSYVPGFDGIFGHTNISGNFGHATYKNLVISNVQGGMVNGAQTSTTVDNVTCSGGQTCFTIYAAATIANSSLSSSSGNCINMGGTETVTVTNTSISGSNTNQSAFYSFSYPLTLTMTNSSLTNSDGTGFDLWAPQSGSVITLSGVTFATANSYAVLSSGLTSDNNTLSQRVNINGSYYTAAQACSTFAQECNSH